MNVHWVANFLCAAAALSLWGGRRSSGVYWKLKSQGFYRFAFKHFGRKSKLINPLKLGNTKFISVGDEVLVNEAAWLVAIKLPAMPEPEMIIKNGTVLGSYNRISCCSRVVLDENVMTADKVHITDNAHIYKDPLVPIRDQSLEHKGDVVIGEGTWIGEGVSVLGCSIGKHCVIGANAVVTRDVPDYCVAAGVPARVIRRYNFITKKWESSARRGAFGEFVSDYPFSGEPLAST